MLRPLPAAVWNAPTSHHSIFDLKLLRSSTNRYHKFIAAAKKSFYAALVQSFSSKPRAHWKTINNILHRTANRSLPTSSPLAVLPQIFATYFSDKISKLHFNLQTNPPFHRGSFSPTFSPSSTPLFHSCHLTRNRQSTISII